MRHSLNTFHESSLFTVALWTFLSPFHRWANRGLGEFKTTCPWSVHYVAKLDLKSSWSIWFQSQGLLTASLSWLIHTASLFFQVLISYDVMYLHASIWGTDFPPQNSLFDAQSTDTYRLPTIFKVLHHVLTPWTEKSPRQLYIVFH